MPQQSIIGLKNFFAVLCEHSAFFAEKKYRNRKERKENIRRETQRQSVYG